MIRDPSYCLQQAVRRLLVASADVVQLVPAVAIHDAWRRPQAPACIVLGEGQTVTDEHFLARNIVRVSLDLHAWTEGAPLGPVKGLAGAIGLALRGVLPPLDAGLCLDFHVAHVRFLRDPSDEWAHAVVTVEALVDLLQANPQQLQATPAAPPQLFAFDNLAVWSITHDLDRRPSVITTDTTGEQVFGDVEYPDLDHVVVTFGFPVSGTASLSW